MKKTIIVLLASMSLNAYAATEVFVTCVTGPVKTSSGVKTYEAQVLTNPTDRGIYAVQFYSNQGSQRTALSLVEVRYSPVQRGYASGTILFDKDQRAVVMYKNVAAQSSKGALEIVDGNELLQVDAVCYSY